MTESSMVRMDTRSKVVLVMLFTTYCLYVITSNVSPPLFEAMRKDLELGDGMAAEILGTRSIGQGVGSVLLGLFVDRVGGKRTMMLVTFFLSLCMVWIALSNSLNSLVVSITVAEIIGSPVWAAHAIIIRAWFAEPSLIAHSFWVLSIASRGGDMVTKGFYGGLQELMSWRGCVFFAAGISGTNFVFTTLFHKNKRPDAKDDNVQSVTDIAEPKNIDTSIVSGTATIEDGKKVELKTALISSSSIASVKEEKEVDVKDFKSFMKLVRNTAHVCFNVICDTRFMKLALFGTLLTIVKRFGQLAPTYLSNVAPKSVKAGHASALSAFFSGGLLAAQLLVGRLYGDWSRKKQMRMCAILTSVTVLSLVALAFLSHPEIQNKESIPEFALKVFLLFTMAFGVAVSYYIIPGVFTVQYGGTHIGLVSAFSGTLISSFEGLFMRFVIKALCERKDGTGYTIAFFILAILTIGGGIFAYLTQKETYIIEDEGGATFRPFWKRSTSDLIITNKTNNVKNSNQNEEFQKKLGVLGTEEIKKVVGVEAGEVLDEDIETQ